MLRSLAIPLLAIGLAIMATGLTLAVLELGAMYTQAANDPLGDPAHDEQTDVPRRMFIRLGVAAVGAVPMLIGLVLWRVGRLRKNATDPILRRSPL